MYVRRFRFSVHSHLYYYGITGPSSSEDYRGRRRASSYQRGMGMGRSSAYGVKFVHDRIWAFLSGR